MVLLDQSKFVFHLVYEAYFGVDVLVICILVFTVFCIVDVYVYIFLLVLSVLV